MRLVSCCEAQQCGHRALGKKAARRGRTLLNLRCTDVEAGLLGRSLLTLVNNKARARTVHDPLSFGI
jgi:hypothetical protein